MGLPPFHSSGCSCPQPTAQRPQGWRFTILRTQQVGPYCVASVKYPDATNYEGKKILVFMASEKEVRAAKFIDPHFCEKKAHLTPIARFEPTVKGWSLAMLLMGTLDGLNHQGM